MDRHTPEQRRKNMQAVKNKNSKIEILLRKELWNSKDFTEIILREKLKHLIYIKYKIK